MRVFSRKEAKPMKDHKAIKPYYRGWQDRQLYVKFSLVLNALPSYMMSIFPMQATVSKCIDFLRRNFLSQGSEHEKVSLRKVRVINSEQGNREAEYQEPK